MKNLGLTLLLIAGLFLYPFGCEGQVNGTLPNNDGCDTVYVDDPSWDAQVKTFEQTIIDLTEQNAIAREDNDELRAHITVLNGSIATLTATITSKNNQISTLNKNVSDLEVLLAECKATPPDTVIDTIYIDKMPQPTVDTVYVTHSNDDKENRKYFHHGSFEAPYPKDITFETKELCMITVEFPDSLGTLRTLDKFKVKRIQDHENARTIYEFIN